MGEMGGCGFWYSELIVVGRLPCSSFGKSQHDTELTVSDPGRSLNHLPGNTMDPVRDSFGRVSGEASLPNLRVGQVTDEAPLGRCALIVLTINDRGGWHPDQP